MPQSFRTGASGSPGHQLVQIAKIGDSAERHEPPVGSGCVAEVFCFSAGTDGPLVDRILQLATADRCHFNRSHFRRFGSPFLLSNHFRRTELALSTKDRSRRNYCIGPVLHGVQVQRLDCTNRQQILRCISLKKSHSRPFCMVRKPFGTELSRDVSPTDA